MRHVYTAHSCLHFAPIRPAYPSPHWRASNTWFGEPYHIESKEYDQICTDESFGHQTPCYVARPHSLKYVRDRSDTPHQKLLGDGFLTPVTLFCLICTIISNKTGIFDQYQNTPQVVAARSLLVAGLECYSKRASEWESESGCCRVGRLFQKALRTVYETPETRGALPAIVIGQSIRAAFIYIHTHIYV